MTGSRAKDPAVTIVKASRLRLIGLALSAFVCALAAVVLAFVVPFVAVLALLFVAWTGACLAALYMQSSVAYRFDGQGVYLGDQPQPAFCWRDVKGATLARGKRRSAVAIVLNDDIELRDAGLLPPWLATFLGRPTDRDLALTNMDTTWQLQPFLDLIQGHLDTYGQIRMENREPTA